VPADSPLAQSGPAGLEELAELPLIGHWTCRVLPHVETELRAQGVEPNFVFGSDIIGTVQVLVGAGVGNAIVPRLAVDFAYDQVSVVDLGPDVPVQPRVIALFCPQNAGGVSLGAGEPHRLSTVWLIIPFALVGAALIGFALVGVYRFFHNRRAYGPRARALPPLQREP
jgi:DNA-binding transcriptional LysR family regulator